MRNSPSERPVKASVLDRLIDAQRELSEDPPVTRAESVRVLKVSLQRDLEWLLNTRRLARELPASSEELRKSLYYYGLPEFERADKTMVAGWLAKHMETAIRTFEPRLANVRVSVRPVEGIDRVAHFIIDGVLLLDPMPEHVTFDTVLELSKGEYRVRGDS